MIEHKEDISFCHSLLTSFVGRGLAPAAVLFGQPRTSVPTVKNKRLFFSLSQKALLGPGHSRGSSHRRLFYFFFLRLKKEDIPHSREDESPYNPLRRLSPPPLPKGEALNGAILSMRREQAPALQIACEHAREFVK